MLEGANIKLASKVSDITSTTATNLLQLIAQEDNLSIAQVASVRNTRCNSTAEEFMDAMAGIVSPLQKELFREVLQVIKEQTMQIKRIETMIQSHTTEAYNKAAEALDIIPGIGRASAEQLVAEIGIDMTRFPSAHHLCSWAGISPGNNESAGKRKSGKTQKGNKTLKRTLVQCATVAVKNKNSFFYAQYQRLVVRIGGKKACVAVAHSMLIAIYHVLSGYEFRDLGSDYYTQFNKEKKIQSHLKQLQKLGWEPPCPAIAS